MIYLVPLQKTWTSRIYTKKQLLAGEFLGGLTEQDEIRYLQGQQSLIVTLYVILHWAHLLLVRGGCPRACVANGTQVKQTWSGTNSDQHVVLFL